MLPLADLLNNVQMTDTDNTNDLCKKETKDRQHGNLFIHPAEMQLHIRLLVAPLSNVQSIGMVNITHRHRNQDQDRQHNQTKVPFLILIQKRYQGISLLIITINMPPIKTIIASFP